MKPSVESLAIDVDAQAWQRSGEEADAIEIALVGGGSADGGGGRVGCVHSGSADSGQEWVLMRVAGDPAGRVLVYDRHEWECFLDGVRGGEFDETGDGRRPAPRPDEV